MGDTVNVSQRVPQPGPFPAFRGGGGFGQRFALLGPAHSGHPFLRVLMVLAIAALLVVLLVGLARLLARRSAPRRALALATPDGALELVRLRYARGELERDEFRRMSLDLGGKPGPEPAAQGSAVSEPSAGAEASEWPSPPGSDAPTATT
jgi:uncharacterized membrane protein